MKKTIDSFKSIKVLLKVLLIFNLFFVSHSCYKHNDDAFESNEVRVRNILTSVPVWKTTKVTVESSGDDVTALNGIFVGLASFNKDETYTITTFDGILRNEGTFKIINDGKTRILNATKVYDAEGNLIPGRTFTRETDITIITPNKFTYRTKGIAVEGGGQVDILVEHVPNS